MKNKYYFPEAARWVSQSWAGAFGWGVGGFGERGRTVPGHCVWVCVFFVLVISIGIFILILQDLGSFHVDTGERGAGQKWKNSALKQQGKEKNNIIELFPANKVYLNPFVFTEAVFMEWCGRQCLCAVGGVWGGWSWPAAHGCRRPPSSHLILSGPSHKSWPDLKRKIMSIAIAPNPLNFKGLFLYTYIYIPFIIVTKQSVIGIIIFKWCHSFSTVLYLYYMLSTFSCSR